MRWCFDKASFLGMVERGKLPGVSERLAAGAIPTEQIHRALQIALLNARAEITHRLLQHGADIHFADREGRQAIYYAADGGDPELIRRCLSLGADVNATDERNVTPLALAAAWGGTEAVRALLEAGADPEIAPRYGGTALIEASRIGDHPKTVEALLEAGADVNAINPSDQRTALHYAADRGHHQLIKRLIDLGAGIDAGDFIGTTPLMLAAANGHDQAVSVLLQYGADLNKCNKHQRSALSWAAGALKPFKVVRHLVEAGADIDQLNGDGESPLSLACSGRSAETVRWLLERVHWLQPKEPNNRPCPLLNSLSHEVEGIQQALLTHPAIDINYRCGSTGITALLWAAATGKHDSLQRLLAAGADAEIPDNQGLHPIQAAAQRWQRYSLEILADHGVSLQPAGHSLLYFSAAGSSSVSRNTDYLGSVQWVLQHVPRPNDEELGHALIRAAARGNVEILTLLLANGANINAHDDDMTPLLAAVGYNAWDDRYVRPKSRNKDPMADAVELLLESGAEVNPPLPYGSLLERAQFMRCPEVVRMLKKRGAQARPK